MTPIHVNAPKVYRLFAEANNAAADTAILRALPRLDQTHRRMALEVLLRRRRLRALVRLVSGFTGYPEELQSDILARAPVLEHALRVAIQQGDSGARAAALELIAKSGDSKLAYLLNGALSQSCPATRELIGKTFLAFADRYLVRRAKVTNDASAAQVRAEGRHLAAALEHALQCWELHLRTEVLTAAVWLVDLLESAIADKVAQPRSRMAHAFNSLLTTQPHPRLAGYALRALTIPPLRARAARIIAQCQDDAFMTALFAESWLLKDPGVCKACASIRELKWLGRSIDPLLRLSKFDAAPAMRFLGATGLPGDAKVTLFSDALASGDAYLSRAALWQLVRIGTSTATKALRTVAQRKDCPAADMARHELYRREPDKSGRRGLGTAERRSQDPTLGSGGSGSAVVVSGAGPPSGEERLQELFNTFAGLEEGERELAFQDPALRTPAAGRYLRAKLASANAEERAQALQIARLANLVGEVEDQVYRLAHDPDAIVRSSAVTALPQMATAAAVRILRNALQDPDSRVQANAIEALDKLELGRYAEWIESKLDSPSGRVRASAIKALLKSGIPGAAEDLLEMLASDVRSERLSALWVVERLNLGSVLERVEALAQDDSDPEVRRRATEIVGAFTPRRPPPEKTERIEALVDEVKS